MCKYEMDPTSIVEDTERTPFCPQTDRRADGRAETSIPPFNFVEARGIISSWTNCQVVGDLRCHEALVQLYCNGLVRKTDWSIHLFNLQIIHIIRCWAWKCWGLLASDPNNIPSLHTKMQILIYFVHHKPYPELIIDGRTTLVHTVAWCIRQQARRCGCDLKCVKFKQNFRTAILSTYSEIGLRWVL